MADSYDQSQDDDEPQDPTQSLGGLGAVSGNNDLLSKVAVFDQLNQRAGAYQPSQQQSPSTLLDQFRGFAMGIMPSAQEIQEQRARWEQQAQQAQQQASQQKWLQFAAGMLSPTKTGSFGESLGYGLQGMAKGMQNEQQVGSQIAQQRYQDTLGLAKFGAEGAKLDATLQALQGRLMKPSPEAVKAASRADLTGKPRNDPLWQARFQEEMQKSQFLANVTPNLKAHIYSSGNPDEMSLADMRRLASTRQTVLDKRTNEAAQIKTNPLFQYGVEDPHEFDTLSGPDLRAHVDKYPMLAHVIDSTLKGDMTLEQLKLRGLGATTIAGILTGIDPNWSTARNKLVNDYKNSKEGSTGAKINAINTAIGHVGTLSTLGDALKNHDVQAGNAILNTILSQFGKSPVNNYQLAQQAVSEELMRVFRQAGASEREASAWGERFSSANSPEKIQDAARTAVELLRSRMDPLNETWKREFHEDYPILTQKSQGVVSALAASAPKKTGNPWLDRAISANPGMKREDVIAEGKKRGKIPADYHD